MKSQKLRVLQWLKRYGSINKLQSVHSLGIWELSARLSELQADGHIIDRSSRIYIKNKSGVVIRIGKAILIKEAKY